MFAADWQVDTREVAFGCICLRAVYPHKALQGLSQEVCLTQRQPPAAAAKS